MHKKIYFLLFLFLSSLLSIGQTLDQSNTPSNNVYGGFNASPTETIGQSFKAGITGSLSQVSFFLYGQFGFTPGDFKITFYQGNGYTGTNLGEQTFSLNSSNFTAQGDLNLSISSPVNIVANNFYTLKVEGITGSVVLWCPNPMNSYADGTIYYNGDLNNYHDLWFKTFVTPPSPSSALNFANSDNGVYINNTLGNFATEDFTIEMDLKTIVSNSYVLSKGSNCNISNFFNIKINNSGRISFVMNAATYESEVDFTGTSVVNDNSWHKISISRVSGKMFLYVDGVLENTFIPTTFENGNVNLINNDVIQIGGEVPCLAFDGTQYFNGNVDEVRFWSRGLSQCEIQNNMNAELPAGQTGLLAYYKFNQGYGGENNSNVTDIIDETGNNNGTLQYFALNGTTSNWTNPGSVTTGVSAAAYANLSAPSNQSFTAGATLESVIVNASNIVWSSDATGNTTLALSTVLVNGATYYAVQTSPCASERLAVTVTVGATGIITSQCGITLDNYNSIVYANTVAYAQGYRFRVTNLTTNVVVTKDYALRNLYLSSLPNFAYNTNYSIEVAVKRNNVWEVFGGACSITTTTPYTTVRASQCGTTLSDKNTNIYADIVRVAQGYRFRVTNLNTYSIQLIDRPLRVFNFNLVMDYADATAYSIDVAVKNTDGEYLSFGTACTVYTEGMVIITRFDSKEDKQLFKVVAYPNPFNESFNLELNSNSSSSVNIAVYDMLGKQLANATISSNEANNYQIGNELMPGVYNVIVTQDEHVQSIRMIKR